MKINKNSLQKTNSSAFYIFIRPYIDGSRVQLERYLEACRILESYEMGPGHFFDKGFYELSSLLEHLNAIETLLRGIEIELPDGKLIRDFRTHLRHDSIGEIDSRSKTRAKRLELSNGLQVSISLSSKGIAMGKTELTANQISKYIDTAEIIAQTRMLGGTIEVINGNIEIKDSPSNIVIKNEDNSDGQSS